METYIVLLRGINVGGKNKVPMSELKKCLEELGYSSVVTYIASGNVCLKSKKIASKIQAEIERELPKKFKLAEDFVKVLVLTGRELKSVVAERPRGFGDKPQRYHSDVIFLINFNTSKALSAFTPKEGVDTIWSGKHVIYSQRLSSRRAQSRLNRVMGTPAYKHMTIRNWNTVTKLVTLLSQ